MPGTATINVRRLQASQQPKVEDLQAHLDAQLPGFALDGSAAGGTVTIIGPAKSAEHTDQITQALAAAIPSTFNALDQKLAIPDVEPAQFYWTYQPDNGAAPQSGRLVTEG